MAIGAGLGLVIGVVITKGKVPPIVCTLGFMNIYRGLTYLIAKSQWVAAYQFTDSFKNFALTKYLGFGIVNNMIAVTIYCYIIFFVVMKWTTVGRRVYAVGSNAEAAAVSGININHVKMGVYTLMGFLCGLGGSLWTSLYKSAQGDMATGIEMDVERLAFITLMPRNKITSSHSHFRKNVFHEKGCSAIIVLPDFVAITFPSFSGCFYPSSFAPIRSILQPQG